MATQTRGYTATKDQLIEHLANLEGQVEAGQDGRRGSLLHRRLDPDQRSQGRPGQGGAGLLDGHVRHCLIRGHGGPSGPDEQAQELSRISIRNVLEVGDDLEDVMRRPFDRDAVRELHPVLTPSEGTEVEVLDLVGGNWRRLQVVPFASRGPAALRQAHHVREDVRLPERLPRRVRPSVHTGYRSEPPTAIPL